MGHREYHFNRSAAVRDVVLGMSDGLTVPFALAAGLSGAHVGTSVVVLAGLAEIAAGCIAMGLGGYLAGQTEKEHYDSERAREIRETREMPHLEEAEVAGIFAGWGLSEDQLRPIVSMLRQDEKRFVDFMMRFELGLEEPDPNQALASAITIGASYVAGGLIPLAPYFFVRELTVALGLSVGITIMALFLFGCGKAKFTGVSIWRGGVQTTLIGAAAASTAFLIARFFR